MEQEVNNTEGLNEETRKLATVRVIDSLEPIVFINQEGEEETASAIEYATVGGWNVVVQKGLYVPGDLAIYVEIDSILPADKEEFAFLEGKRLRTKKLKGHISQGICFPLFVLSTTLNEGLTYDADNGLIHVEGETGVYEIAEDLDLTTLLGVTKYEPGEPQDPNAQGNFPWFIHKTNENRVQNNLRELKKNEGKLAYITEKLEGSSISLYVMKDDEGVVKFGVCSRNQELKYIPGTSKFVDVAVPYVEKLIYLRERDIIGDVALQGELIGEGIQGNIYKMKGNEINFFTAFDIRNSKKADKDYLDTLVRQIGGNTVPILGEITLSTDMKAYLEMAEGKSQLNPQTEREGIVIRTYDNSFSMKAISNRYLLKQK